MGPDCDYFGEAFGRYDEQEKISAEDDARDARRSDEALADLRERLTGKRDTGMTLEATLTDGHHVLFDRVSVDSARIERGVLVFETDDRGTYDVRVTYVPNVSHWSTFYR